MCLVSGAARLSWSWLTASFLLYIETPLVCALLMIILSYFHRIIFQAFSLMVESGSQCNLSHCEIRVLQPPRGVPALVCLVNFLEG